jgi:hypothetical protein
MMQVNHFWMQKREIILIMGKNEEREGKQPLLRKQVMVVQGNFKLMFLGINLRCKRPLKINIYVISNKCF